MKQFGVRVYKQYFNFASAHFLIFEDGGREELHGHNYQVRVKTMGEIGPDDMVIDFCKLKPVVKRCCDELDHRTLLQGQHPKLEVGEDDGHIAAAFTRTDGGVDRFLFPTRDALVLPIHNTSTERLAEYLSGQILDILRADGQVSKLSSFEIEVEEAGGQCGVCVIDPVE